MGLFEILLIAVVTLLVVGPEKMPSAVRSVALTIGRVKRAMNSAREEIEKQVGFDEVRQQLSQEAVTQKINKINEGVSDIDQKISAGDQSMPWTEDEYHALQANGQVSDKEPKSTPLASVSAIQ
jgi:sec-independent protein translocase protein TatB